MEVRNFLDEMYYADHTNAVLILGITWVFFQQYWWLYWRKWFLEVPGTIQEIYCASTPRNAARWFETVSKIICCCLFKVVYENGKHLLHQSSMFRFAFSCRNRKLTGIKFLAHFFVTDAKCVDWQAVRIMQKINNEFNIGSIFCGWWWSDKMVIAITRYKLILMRCNIGTED
jgi:hypothetical protein